MKIWNATIHTMTDAGILENGYVCIENGKITEVGTGTPSVLAPEDIDAGGSVLLPGFIDAHTHLGIIENGSEREAFAEGIAPNGFLICSDENGRFEVNSGEVSVRGLMDYI